MRNILFALSLFVIGQSCTEKSDTKENLTERQFRNVVLADTSYIEKGKKSMAHFASGNIENWVSDFSDKAIFSSNGDSIKGKVELLKYWNERRQNVIEDYQYSNDFWISVEVMNVNKGLVKGVWVFCWFDASIKYKTGKIANLKIHNGYHFDSEGKIDLIIHYVDKEPISKALRAE